MTRERESRYIRAGCPPSRAARDAWPRHAQLGQDRALPISGPKIRDQVYPRFSLLSSKGVYFQTFLSAPAGTKTKPSRGLTVPEPTRPERFELPTFGSVDRRSIQLS
jgi:hypothetical protein